MKNIAKVIALMLVVVSLAGCFGGTKKDPAKMSKKIVAAYQTGQYKDIVRYVSVSEKKQLAEKFATANVLGTLFGAKKTSSASTEDEKVSEGISELNNMYRTEMQKKYGALQNIVITGGQYSPDKTGYTATVKVTYAKKEVGGDLKFKKGEKAWELLMIESNPLGK